MRRGLWIALFIFLGVAGAVYLFRKPLLRTTLPTVERVQFTEVDMTTDSARVHLRLLIRNKGIWDFRLKSVVLGAYDDTTQLVGYRNDSNRTLLRKEVKVEEFIVTIPVKKLIRGIRQHQGDDSVYIDIRGELQLEVFGNDLERVINQRIAIKPPIPPKVSLQQVEYAGKEDGKHNLVLVMNLVNRNDRRFVMKDLRYDLTGEKLIAAHGFIASLDIEPLDSTTIRIPVEVKVKNQVVLISRVVLFKDNLEYSFVLHGTIASVEGVVEDDVPAVFRASGTVKPGGREWAKDVKFVVNKDKKKKRKKR